MRSPDDEYGYPKSFQARKTIRSKPRKLERRPMPKKRQRKKPKVDVGGLVPERDWDTLHAMVMARPSGGLGYWKGDKFLLMTAGRCERCGKNRATDAHHRRLVSEGGPDVASNLAALCRGCHDWCHMNRRLAESGGWIVGNNRWATRALTLWDGSMVTLDDDAGYAFVGYPKG